MSTTIDEDGGAWSFVPPGTMTGVFVEIDGRMYPVTPELHYVMKEGFMMTMKHAVKVIGKEEYANPYANISWEWPPGVTG